MKKLINIDELKKIIKKKKFEKFEDDIVEVVANGLDKLLTEKLKEIHNKKRIISNDETKEHKPARQILSFEQIEKLPSWVKEDIDNASIVGSSNKVIQISNGKKYHLDNKLNDLSGGEWTFFLNSVINTRYSTNGEEGFAHNIRKIHPSPKPPQLTRQIIEFFTKENQLVLDYFMGVGGTLLGASLCNRRALGIDLNDIYINAYNEASDCLGLKKQSTLCGNSLDILTDGELIKDYLGNEKFSLILIDPPYGDMLSRAKTGETLKNKKDSSPTPFTDKSEDLGNMERGDFLEALHNSICSSMEFLNNKGHIVIFIKDLQPKDKELNLLHSDIILKLNSLNTLKYLGTKIWADQSVNLYPYGYPFGFVSNQIHQYILIFQKR
jgi:DNA modification methylase